MLNKNNLNLYFISSFLYKAKFVPAKNWKINKNSKKVKKLFNLFIKVKFKEFPLNHHLIPSNENPSNGLQFKQGASIQSHFKATSAFNK